MKRKYGQYWTVVPGQLPEDVEVESGHKTRKRAEKIIQSMSPCMEKYSPYVANIATLEHELPADHPDFCRTQVFGSRRWCVVVNKAGDELIRNKSRLIPRLERFMDSGDCRSKGQRPFIRFLIQYLKDNAMPGDDPRYKDIVNIDPYIDDILLDAVVAFRTSTEQYAANLRKIYKKETGRDVPDIHDLSMETTLMILTHLQFVAEKVMGGYSRHASNKIESLCKAHFHFLNMVFRKFIREVWRTGMLELIEKTNLRGLQGVFGGVTVLICTMCGRTTVQFDDKDGRSVNFAVGENDYGAYSAGLNSSDADVVTAVNMIETVIANWPRDKAEQKKVFYPDKKVKNLGVAIMEAQAEQQAAQTAQ